MWEVRPIMTHDIDTSDNLKIYRAMAIDKLITKLTMLIDAQGSTEYQLGLKTALRLANEAKLSASEKPDVIVRSEQLKAFVDWWHGLSQEELVWYEGRYVEVFLSL